MSRSKHRRQWHTVESSTSINLELGGAAPRFYDSLFTTSLALKHVAKIFREYTKRKVVVVNLTIPTILFQNIPKVKI